LRRSARLPVLAALQAELQRPILLLTARPDRGLTLYDELSLWAPDVPRLYFPDPNPLFYEQAAWGENTRRDRLVALTTLAAYHVPGAATPPQPPILIAPARALMTRTIPRRDFLKASRTLKRDEAHSPGELARNWVHLGYESVNTVIMPGQFARRGGILDVWPIADPRPTRIEFFGDEIDTLRAFDPATQMTLKGKPHDRDRLLIPPACEYLRTANAPEGLPEQLSEFHIPLLYPQPASLLDYLPRDGLVVIDDLQALQECCRVLKPAGIALLTLAGDFTQQETRKLHKVDWLGHYRYYGLDVLDLFREAGFEVEMVNMGAGIDPKWGVREGDMLFVGKKGES